MAIDYTVIESVRQHLGDSPTGDDPMTRDFPLSGFEPQAPFLGPEYPYPFDCPGVAAHEWAVLVFSAFGVSARTNTIRINGVDLPGGIYQTPVINVDDVGAMPMWHTETLLIPQDVLRATGNWLYLQSNSAHPSSPGGGTDRDDFIVDNVIVWFKVIDHGVNPPRKGPVEP
jgi:hypothetical protein